MQTHPIKVALTLLILSTTVPTHASPLKTLYVSNIGSDSKTGASLADAKATIQSAITSASSGSTIYLEPGTYTGDGNINLTFSGGSITVSSDPANGGNSENTNINLGGSPNNYAFEFIQGETSAARVIGLTIENGSRPGGRGGAIIVSNASTPTIKDCVFKNNQALYGGAIVALDSSPTIRECTFTGNKALPVPGDNEPATGGAIELILDSSAAGVIQPIITNCVFQNNVAFSDGAAIDISGDTTPMSPAITNCTFYQNVSNQSGTIRPGGAIGVFGATPVITNCILFGNIGGEIAFVTDPAPPMNANATISHCDLDQKGYTGSGNIDKNPALSLDTTISSASPCAKAGTAAVPAGVDITIDRNGQARGAVPWIGAYEETAKPPAK